MLARGLELTDSAYVPGFRIWERELAWAGQGMTRKGYVFLGAPNENTLDAHFRGNDLSYAASNLKFFSQKYLVPVGAA